MNLNAHQRYLIEEFADEYQERKMGRRELLRRVLLITGSIPVTAAVLTSLGCGADDGDDASRPAPAATSDAAARTTEAARAATTAAVPATPGVPPSDPAIAVADVRFPGPGSELLGYVARPSAAGTYPGILVIHENRGLVDHIKDVARRYAREGFAAFAIDLVSRDGGTKPDAAANSGFLAQGGDAKTTMLIEDLLAGLAYLKAQPYVGAKPLGVTGFCFGGGYTWETAISSRDVRAAAPYYGTVRRMNELRTTQAAILAIYGEADARITAQAPQVEEQLKASGRPYEIKIYPGAGHAFFNDTGQNYRPEPAADAWRTTLAWFRRHLA